MRVLWRCQLGLVVIAVLADAPQASAQDQLKVEIIPQIAHSDRVISVAFSHDGMRALSGASNGRVKLWDAATGRLIRTFTGHTDRVVSVAFRRTANGCSLARGTH
jgi:WD40 repeat protein